VEQHCNNPSQVVEGVTPCPRCGHEGRSVSSLTLESLVHAAARVRLRSFEGFRFCATRVCNVAYFHPVSGDILTCPEVVVPIFQKSTSPERLVCYCFGHTVAGIQREVGATLTSGIATDIKAKCGQGLDDCARTNPQGNCCLGNVQRVIREASGDTRPPPADGGGCCCH
jgi:hypothetical protein